MDIFNKKKIVKYEEDLVHMKQDMDALRKENDTLKRKINGERVCSGYCAVCKNRIEETHYGFAIGSYKTYSCALDCRCKDFERDVT